MLLLSGMPFGKVTGRNPVTTQIGSASHVERPSFIVQFYSRCRELLKGKQGSGRAETVHGTPTGTHTWSVTGANKSSGRAWLLTWLWARP